MDSYGTAGQRGAVALMHAVRFVLRGSFVAANPAGSRFYATSSRSWTSLLPWLSGIAPAWFHAVTSMVTIADRPRH